jgi:lantibiotic modifying enzyme
MSPWKPIASGAIAEECNRIINAIAGDINSLPNTGHDWGPALLLSYLARARDSAAHRAEAERRICAVFDAIEENKQPWFFGGFTGLAWLIVHTDAMFGRVVHSVYEDMDDALLTIVKGSVVPSHDLIVGAVGVGVYFLERLPSPKAIAGLSVLIDLLGRTGQQSDDGIAWFTPSWLVYEHQREFAPNGYYNLGVAHGIGGVVGLLAYAHGNGVSSRQSAALLRDAIRWLLRQRLEDGSFPPFLVPGSRPTRSRVAWCYGELGLSLVLLAAGEALEDTLIHDQAIDIGLMASARRQDTGVVDAGLCHGAAGNAHLFNRLYQATGLEEFLQASLFWLKMTLDMRMEGQGIGGYQAWGVIDYTKTNLGWVDDPWFLVGASGIALALLGAVSSVAPDWDIPLLCRLPPKRLVTR